MCANLERRVANGGLSSPSGTVAVVVNVDAVIAAAVAFDVFDVVVVVDAAAAAAAAVVNAQLALSRSSKKTTLTTNSQYASLSISKTSNRCLRQ